MSVADDLCCTETAEIVDTRGLSCPQPVLLALSTMRELEDGEIRVIGDNEESRENIQRAAAREGWEVLENSAEGETFQLRLRRH